MTHSKLELCGKQTGIAESDYLIALRRKVGLFGNYAIHLDAYIQIWKIY